jgi:hypothetical protein
MTLRSLLVCRVAGLAAWRVTVSPDYPFAGLPVCLVAGLRSVLCWYASGHFGRMARRFGFAMR